MSTCHPTLDLQAYADGQMEANAACSVAAHLHDCARCERVVRWLRLISSALGHAPAVSIPAGLPERLLGAPVGRRGVGLPRCGEVPELLSAYHDSELPAPRAEALEAHIFACDDCFALFATQSRLIAALRSVTPEPAPAGLQARILGAVARSEPVVIGRVGWRRLVMGVSGAAAAAALILAMVIGAPTRAPIAPPTPAQTPPSLSAAGAQPAGSAQRAHEALPAEHAPALATAAKASALARSRKPGPAKSRVTGVPRTRVAPGLAVVATATTRPEVSRVIEVSASEPALAAEPFRPVVSRSPLARPGVPAAVSVAVAPAPAARGTEARLAIPPKPAGAPLSALPANDGPPAPVPPKAAPANVLLAALPRAEGSEPPGRIAMRPAVDTVYIAPAGGDTLREAAASLRERVARTSATTPGGLMAFN